MGSNNSSEQQQQEPQQSQQEIEERDKKIKYGIGWYVAGTVGTVLTGGFLPLAVGGVMSGVNFVQASHKNEEQNKKKEEEMNLSKKSLRKSRRHKTYDGGIHLSVPTEVSEPVQEAQSMDFDHPKKKPIRKIKAQSIMLVKEDVPQEQNEKNIVEQLKNNSNLEEEEDNESIQLDDKDNNQNKKQII